MTELKKISRFSTAMINAATLDDLLWLIAKNIGEILGFDDCVVYLNVNNNLIQKAAFGIKNPQDRSLLNEKLIPVGQGIVGAVAQSKTGEIVSDTKVDKRYIWDEFSGNSELTVPIIYENETIGIIDSESSRYDAYNQNDKELLQIIANIAAPRIASAQYCSQLQQTQIKLEKTNHELAISLKQLKENQEALIQSEKMASIGLLAAGVAHEINNPLSFSISNLYALEEYNDTIKQMYQTLCKHPSLPNELKKHLQSYDNTQAIKDIGDIISETSEGLLRIKNIVADLCGYARNEGKVLGFFDINKIIDVASNLLRGEINKNCHLDLELGQLPDLYGNETKLLQVFMNIIHNAIQATTKGGQVKVKTYLDNNFACIDISDTGSGISSENLLDVFTPFYTTKPVGAGTGLGLFISYQIITEEYKGKIKVSSNQEKTTFRVMLPMLNPTNLLKYRP